jgi:D-amino-acid dehydrogenase
MMQKAIRMMFDKRSPFFIRPTLEAASLHWFLRFASRCRAPAVLEAMRARSALLNSSRALYDRLLAEEDLPCEFTPDGLLMVYRSEKALHELDVWENRLGEFGVESRTVVQEELRRMEPSLRQDVFGAHFYPIDAHLRPDQLVGSWCKAVRARGAKVEENLGTVRLEAAGDRVTGATTPRGRFRAGSYLLAAGAWTAPLARRVGLRIPVLPGKGYTVTMKPPSPAPRYPMVLKERAVAVTPWKSAYRLGGTMEFTGYDDRLDPDRIQAILEGATVYLLNAVPDGEEERWCSFRPMSADGMPFIGPSPRHRNLFVAAGHGMLGMSMAPGTGKLVAELLTGESPHLDPRPYRVGRG